MLCYNFAGFSGIPLALFGRKTKYIDDFGCEKMPYVRLFEDTVLAFK